MLMIRELKLVKKKKINNWNHCSVIVSLLILINVLEPDHYWLSRANLIKIPGRKTTF